MGVPNGGIYRGITPATYRFTFYKNTNSTLSMMKIFLATIAALAPVAYANFDLYVDTQASWASPEAYTYWSIYEAEPYYNQVINSPAYGDSDDVSGTKSGVRCEGDGCQGGIAPYSITTLEMNFHGDDPVYHWSKSHYVLVSYTLKWVFIFMVLGINVICSYL
jgi:hypothetical protein